MINTTQTKAQVEAMLAKLTVKELRDKRTGLTLEAKAIYNQLLMLNWSEPYITMDDLEQTTGIERHTLAPVLGELISARRVLSGNEDVLGGTVYTYTPIIKGQAYGYPLDFFKSYYEFMENAL